MEKKKQNIDEGTWICDSPVVEDPRQMRLQIPVIIKELLGARQGDIFRWYVKRREGKNKTFIKISAVYIGRNLQKFKWERKLISVKGKE